MANTLLDLETFNGKMNSLKELEALTIETMPYNQSSISSTALADWLLDNNIIERALRGNLHHQQYVEKLQVSNLIYFLLEFLKN